jgi:hypothetical protein
MRKAAFALAVLAAVLSALGWMLGMRLADGAFTYPLDDSYIHLQIASTLAESGTWGIEKGVPVFASSSPLWTLLLAVGCLVLGAAEWLPLALSFLFATLSVFVLYRFWSEADVPVPTAVLGGLAFVFFTPFIVLTNLGMEHALHVFCVLTFLFYAWRTSRSGTTGDFVRMLVFAFLSAGARYESLFIITPVALLFLMPVAAGGYAKPKFGLFLLLVQFLPIVAMGLYAVSCGRPFFPVSLLLKANVDGGGVINGIISLYFGITKETVHFHVLVGLLLYVAVTKRNVLCVALAFAAIGHGVLAQLGWLYRYEAYLVTCGIALLVVAVSSGRREEKDDAPWRKGFVFRYSYLLLVVALAFPFVYRSFSAHYDIIVAQREINAQQKQMGRVFATLPPALRGAVAVTDLGCVAFYSGVHILDLWGLGSPEVAEIIRHGENPVGGFGGLFARNDVRYFALYDKWCDISKVSPDARVVGELTLKYKPVICAGQRVLLGVLHSADAPTFAAHLKSLTQSMPSACELTVFPTS